MELVEHLSPEEAEHWRLNELYEAVAHGITDTIDFLLMFFGKYPGM